MTGASAIASEAGSLREPEVGSSGITCGSPLIVSCGTDRAVRCWNIDTGRCERSMQGPGLETAHGDSVSAVAVTPDGRSAVSAGMGFLGTDNTLRVWDLASGQCKKTLQCPVSCIGALPDGQRIVGGSFASKALHEWDLESGACSEKFQGLRQGIVGLAVAPDGRSVYCLGGHEDRIYVWDEASGRLTAELQDGGTAGNISMAPSPDGDDLVVGTYEGDVNLWDLQSGQCKTRFKGPDAEGSRRGGCTVYAVAVSADGRTVLSAGRDRTVCLWEVSSGQRVAVLEGHTDIIYSMALAGDCVITGAGGNDPTVRVWDLTAGGTCRAVMEGHTGAILGLAVAHRT